MISMTTENTGLFGAPDPDLDDNYEIAGASGTDELLQSLVGEDKKYKTPADLAFAKLNADNHIKRIQEENKALRERLAREEALQDLLKRVGRNDAPEQTSNPAHESGEERGAPSLEDLEAKVLARLEERTKKEQEARNMQAVAAKVKEALGPNFQSELRARLADADLDEATADRLARNNPKAFLKLIGVAESTPPRHAPSLFEAPAPKSQFNTASQVPVSGEKTKSYYDKIKQKMGVRAFAQDRNLQAQMHNDALRLGERFFDT